MTCTSAYDIIFYDPPYNDEALAGLLPKILELLSSGGTLIHERANVKKSVETEQPPIDHERFSCENRVYGDTRADFYTRRNA